MLLRSPKRRPGSENNEHPLKDNKYTLVKGMQLYAHGKPRIKQTRDRFLLWGVCMCGIPIKFLKVFHVQM